MRDQSKNYDVDHFVDHIERIGAQEVMQALLLSANYLSIYSTTEPLPEHERDEALELMLFLNDLRRQIDLCFVCTT